MSSLPSFLGGTYNNAGFTQTFGATEVGQTNPNVGLESVGDPDVAHVLRGKEAQIQEAITASLGIAFTAIAQPPTACSRTSCS